jgi:hypothetical protein
MAICASRKRTTSIMANSKFGDVEIQKGNYVVELPQTAINQTNLQIKQFVQRKLERLDQLTIADVLHLQNKYSVGVTMR